MRLRSSFVRLTLLLDISFAEADRLLLQLWVLVRFLVAITSPWCRPDWLRLLRPQFAVVDEQTPTAPFLPFAEPQQGFGGLLLSGLRTIKCINNTSFRPRSIKKAEASAEVGLMIL